MGLELFFSYYIPPARAAYMVAKALNLPIQLKEIEIFSKFYKSEELMQLNPQHTIPTLKDGNFAVWDCHAIAGYLVDQYFPNHKLYPKNPQQRAIINQRLHMDTGELFPRFYNAVMPLLMKFKTVIPTGACSQLYKSYDFLNFLLEQNKWLAGNNMTIADLCCVSTISSSDYFVPVSKKRHPVLYEYLQRFYELPYYEEANLIGLDKLGTKVQESIMVSKINE